MTDDNALLQQAIERNTPVTIGIASGGVAPAHRSRMVGAEGESVLLESVVGQADAVDALIRSAQPVLIAFRSDTQRAEFSAVILERRRGYRLNGDALIEVIRVAWPKALRVVQRRNNYRVSVTPDSGVNIEAWRVSDQHDIKSTPPSTQQVHIDVRDLSIGGLGGIWRRKPTDPSTLASDQRFILRMTHEKDSLVIEARLQFIGTVPDPDLRRVGLKFDLKPNQINDRLAVGTLTKLMGELQRAELRRKKMAR